MRAAWVAVVIMVGCVKSQSVQCDDGRTCPDQTKCDAIHTACVTPDQLRACAVLSDGEACTADVVDDGLCDRGVCLAARCGDGYRTVNELCDGDMLSKMNCRELGYYDDVPLRCNDGCSFVESDCTGECKDGIVQREHELCDGAPPSESCVDFGYGAGFLGCNQCGPGIEDCKLFGWGLPKTLPAIATDLHGTSSSNIWAVGGTNVLHFDGKTWSEVTLTGCNVSALSFTAVWAVGTEAFVVGDGGRAYRVTLTGCTEIPVPGNTLRLDDVSGTSANDVYATGYSGLYHFNGTSWSEVTASGFTQTLADGAVWARTPTDVWAGRGSTLKHFDGSSWTTATAVNVSGMAITAIWGAAANDVYAGGFASSSSYLFHFDGNGWTQVYSFSGHLEDGVAANGRHFLSGNRSDSVGIVRVLDDGEWVDLDPPVVQKGLSGLFGLPSGELYVVPILDSRVFRFAGSMRNDRAFGGGYIADHVAMTSSIASYVTTSDGDLAFGGYIWLPSGTTWSQDNTISNVVAFSVVPGTDTVFAVNNDGLQSRTPTTAWVVHDAGLNVGSLVWTAALNDVWVFAGLNRVLHHWIGTGEAPVCATCVAPQSVLGMWGTSPSNVYAVGPGGMILHWNGSAWLAEASGTQRDLWAIWGSGPTDIYTVGGNGTVLHSDGATWTDVSLPSAAQLYVVSGSGPGDVWVGGDNGLLMRRDSQARWSPVASGTTFAIVAIGASPSSVVWFDAFGDLHRLLRTFTW